MMFRYLFSVFVGLLAPASVIGQRTEEFITLRVSNPQFSTTKANLMKMLKEADLEGRGFQKEESRIMLAANKANSSVFVTSLYYYKVVDCSKVIQIILELDGLFPGAMGPAVDNRVAKEVKGKKLDTMKKCRAGVEFHVHVKAAGQSYNSISTFGRFKRNANECCCCCKVEAVV